MKITDILKLAMKNLTGHKRIMLRVAVSVLTVVLLCCSAAVFVSAVTDELSDIPIPQSRQRILRTILYQK